MSPSVSMQDVLGVVEVVREPDERGHVIGICLICGEPHLEVYPDGGGEPSAVCHKGCKKYDVRDALRERVSTARNGGGQDAPAKRTKTTKAGSDERLKELRAALVEVEKEGKRVEDWLRFQARCVERFGPGAGLLLRQLTFLTGLSTKLSGGWFYKSRAELRRETGLGNSDIRKARRILTGQKPYGGYGEVRVLEEYEPPKRAPMQYRVDLETLALALDAGDSEGAS